MILVVHTRFLCISLNKFIFSTKSFFNLSMILKNKNIRNYIFPILFQFRIETQDRRGAILSFRCTLIHVDNRILLDFRLSRGCGIEFKKHFAKIKNNCGSIIEKGPILWPTLISSDAIPGPF